MSEVVVSPHWWLYFLWFSLSSWSMMCAQNLSRSLHTWVLLVVALRKSHSCSYSVLLHEFKVGHWQLKSHLWVQMDCDSCDLIYKLSSNPCNSKDCTLYILWKYLLLCLTFQLCNMFACIVKDTQIILYHIFLGPQQNMVQTILFIPTRPRVESLCVSIFVRSTTVLSDRYFVPNFLSLSCGSALTLQW